MADHRLAITLLGVAAIAALAVLLIECSLRPVSLGISLEPSTRTNGNFLITIPGRYALNLACPRSDLPKMLIDGFGNSQQPVRISCDIIVAIRHDSKSALETNVLSLRSSTLGAETMSFRLADLDTDGMGSFEWEVAINRPPDMFTTANARLELQLAAPMREYRMIWAFMLKLLALVSGISGLGLVVGKRVRIGKRDGSRSTKPARILV